MTRIRVPTQVLPSLAVAASLLSLVFACQKKSSSQTEAKVAVDRVETVKCDYARNSDGTYSSFSAVSTLKMGPDPRSVELKNEAKPGASSLNPLAEDAEKYVRAASGVRILLENPSQPMKVVVAQDSRRKLGVATFQNSLKDLQSNASILAGPEVSMVAVDSPEAISLYDDNSRDYESYRKTAKMDFEASTTMPDGSLLFIGSGSDMQKVYQGRPSFRSAAKILSSSGEFKVSYDLLPLYLNLNEKKALIGEANKQGPAEINFEGLAVRPGPQGPIIAFFNRGNFNGNGHNAVIEYDFAAWFAKLKDTQGLSREDARKAWNEIQPLRIVKIELPRVASASDPSGATFPMTLNDALFGQSAGKSTYFMPAGTEAEYTDSKGVQHDGEVTFAGLIKWQGVDELGSSRCEIFQAPGDPAPGLVSTFGKVEGLAAYNPSGNDLFTKSLYSDEALVLGVTDVDSEIKASQISVLKFSK